MRNLGTTAYRNPLTANPIVIVKPPARSIDDDDDPAYSR